MCLTWPECTSVVPSTVELAELAPVPCYSHLPCAESSGNTEAQTHATEPPFGP